MSQRKSLLKNLYPKYTFEKVEDIPYDLIKKDGIKLILMDMDNTLIDNRGKYSKGLRKWIKDIKAKGIELYIVSNSFSTKVVKRISKELGVKYYYKASKPRRKGFRAVCEHYPDISKKEILMIGDQLFTDVWGGNRYNINTCLVRRINKRENIVSAIKRPFERIILMRYYSKEENKEKCRV
jgi:HAD superfamily phosphatase (TIGR01668 family)